MFAHRAEVFKRLLGFVAVVSALALCAGLTACGSDDTGAAPESDAAPTGATGTAKDADLERADPEDVEVVGAWIAALTEGDVDSAADYFAIPSVAQNGPVQVRIDDREDAVAFNESLPCGAEVIAAETSGEKTIVTFELSERPGGGCGPGAGGTARTSFVIEDGKIVEWWRLGDPPQPSRIDPDTV
jgi:hypothetical protein